MISVLYIDDEPGLLEIGKLFLEDNGGFSVDCELSAKDALSRIAHGNYDAVVSDYQMPGMDGITLLKKVRIADRSIPFILFTGRGREEVVIEALNNGADFYLQKGGEPESQFVELAHKIRLAVDRCRAESAIKRATGLLTATLNSTADGILVVDNAGKIVQYNQKFREMWHVPESVLGSRDDQMTLSYVMGQLKRPGEFAARVEQLYKTPSACGLDIVDLLDGRVFERYSQPQMHGDAIAGRVWSFRDITPRILVEMELRAANEQMAAALDLLKATEGSLLDQNRQLTEQKRTLAEAEERFRFFMNHLPGTVWAIDPAMRFTLSQGSGLGELGLAPDHVVGMSLTALFGTDNPSHPVIAGHSRALLGENVDFEYEHKGSFFRISLSPVHDIQGHITGVAGIAVDITDNWRSHDEVLKKNEDLSQLNEELRAYEEELRQNLDELGVKDRQLSESEEMFRRAFHACPAPIILSRAESGKYLDVNEQFLTTLGYTREDVIGRTSNDIRFFVNPAEREVMVEHLHADRRIRNKEYRLHRKNGTELLALVNAELFELNNEDCILFIVDDITAEREAQEEILRKNEELSRLTEELMASEEELRQNIAELGAKERLLTESERKFSSLYMHMIEGAALHELTYDNLGAPEDYIIIETNPAFSLQLDIPRETVIGRTSREAYGVTTPPYFDIYARVALSGKPEVFETYFAPLSKHFSISVFSPYKGSFATIFEDITSRRRAEETLLQANRKLNLLSDITRHDITNQLSVLKGYLTLMEKKQPNPIHLEYIRKASASAQCISSMIRFTREYELIGVNAPVWQECRSLVHISAGQITSGRVRIQNDLPAGMEVFADPLVVKVFYNLMDNAVQYGGKIRTIRFASEQRNGDQIIVCEDDGDGIPGDLKEMIFDHGFGKNTGLGLALTREILDITGMTIRETGEHGAGARFEITVPGGAYRSRESEQR